MYKVQILMSTYNGIENLERQIESIIKQEEVDISILIRDDGSTDGTIELINKLQNKYLNKIRLIIGENIGWKSSFINLLFDVGDYDFYGFSDQDDYWLPRKVIECINLMKNDNEKVPKLAHCNSISVDENLQKRNENENRIKKPPNHKIAITTEIFQGCGMIWNKEAMKLVLKYKPKNKNIAHDYWVGIICYFFGKIYFTEESYFYHIRYANNSSTDGNVLKGRINRIKKIFSKSKIAYMNPAEDLLEGYADLLLENDIKFLKDLINYKKNFLIKLKLLFDGDFRKISFMPTLLLKFSILINKF